MSLKLNSASGGSITLQEPSTPFTRTLLLPDRDGTVITSGDSGTITQDMINPGVAGKGPYFMATNNNASAQTGLTNATYNKVSFPAEEYDSNGWYNNTTYRFTPLIEGFYFFGWASQGGSTDTYGSLNALYKNGAVHRYGTYYNGKTAYPFVNFLATGAALAYANGSTDYFEVYHYIAGSTTGTIQANTGYFTGVLVRGIS